MAGTFLEVINHLKFHNGSKVRRSNEELYSKHNVVDYPQWSVASVEIIEHVGTLQATGSTATPAAVASHYITDVSNNSSQTTFL